MRLLYCSRDYTTHDRRFVRAITDAAIDVCYLRLESDGVAYVAEPLPTGARWVAWAGGGVPRPIPGVLADLLPAYAKVVGDIRPDVIHAGPVQSFGLMAALTRLAPSVLVSWGSDVLVDARRDAWYEWATRTALRQSDAFLCDSAVVLAAARDVAGGTVPPHVCLPWGPETLPSPADAGRRAALRAGHHWEDAFVVVATRAWHHGYRIPQLVDAFAAAARRDRRLLLALLGDGAEAPAVEERIRRHDLAARVFRPGVVPEPEVRRIFEAADAYLSLVPSDGSSISLLEAMAHGLPVVVTRNAGNAEWVTDGATGYLVGDDEGRGAADRLVELAADPAAARRIGEGARTVVQARADWQANVARVIALYRRTAAQGRAATTPP